MRKKVLIIVLIILIHFIASMIVQLGLLVHSVFNDYSVKSNITWIIIGIALSYIDYYACIRILGDNSISVPWIVHIADLALAIPAVALYGYCFIEDVVVYRDIGRTEYNIILVSGIILIDICLVLERINLINRNH